MVEPQTWHQCVLSWNDQSPDIVSVGFGMIWWSPRHSICLFCHEMVKLQTWHQCVLSWNDQSPDIVSVGFGMKWSSPRHSINLFCHEMVKLQTWHQCVCHEMINPQILYQLDLAWNGQAPDIISICFVMKWSSTRHSISWFWHEMVKAQT